MCARYTFCSVLRSQMQPGEWFCTAEYRCGMMVRLVYIVYKHRTPARRTTAPNYYGHCVCCVLDTHLQPRGTAGERNRGGGGGRPSLLRVMYKCTGAFQVAPRLHLLYCCSSGSRPMAHMFGVLQQGLSNDGPGSSTDGKWGARREGGFRWTRTKNGPKACGTAQTSPDTPRGGFHNKHTHPSTSKK